MVLGREEGRGKSWGAVPTQLHEADFLLCVSFVLHAFEFPVQQTLEVLIFLAQGKAPQVSVGVRACMRACRTVLYPHRR